MIRGSGGGMRDGVLCITNISHGKRNIPYSSFKQKKAHSADICDLWSSVKWNKSHCQFNSLAFSASVLSARLFFKFRPIQDWKIYKRDPKNFFSKTTTHTHIPTRVFCHCLAQADTRWLALFRTLLLWWCIRKQCRFLSPRNIQTTFWCLKNCSVSKR